MKLQKWIERHGIEGKYEVTSMVESVSSVFGKSILTYRYQPLILR